MNKLDIKSYSLMAGTFLLMKGPLQAEIVYVDIEPDIVLDSNADAFIDLDQDGTMDYLFSMNSWFGAVFGGYYGSYTFSSISLSGKSIRANGLAGNEMMASSYTSTSKGSVYYFYAVSPLLSGVLVNTYGNFVGDDYMFHMAFKKRVVTAVSHEPLGGWFYFGMIEPWNYPELHGEDRYAGVRFSSGDDCKLYGWIRCAVIDSNEQLIIKDYAYESSCNWAIYTGDTSGGHTSSNIDNLLQYANVYSNHNIIYVNILQMPQNAFIQITNLNGIEIFSSTIQNPQTAIELSDPGIYFVSLNFDGRIYTKKVVIL